MKVNSLIFPDDFNREEAIAISALLQRPDESQFRRAVLDKCYILDGRFSDQKLQRLTSVALKAGMVVAIVED